MKKVLVATDFSEQSKQLLGCVDEFIDLGIEEVVLCYVVDVSVSGGGALSFKEYAEKKLAETKHNFEALGLQVKVVVPIGFPATEINELAQREKVSFIIMASQGAGYVKSLLLGNTTFDVIQITDTPVLIKNIKTWMRR